MTHCTRLGVCWLVLALFGSACVGPTAPGGAGTTDGAAQPQAPKRLVAAIMEEPLGVNRTVNLDAGAGTDALEELLHAGLANVDDRNRWRLQLAETLPTIENGLWKVLPAGGMETTWKINRQAVWQDGVPFTSADLVFTGEVGRDRSDLAIRRYPAFDAVDVIEAPDPYTLTVRWKRPFIYADTLFTRGLGAPMPKHLLERSYLGEKAGFTQLPYWTQEFIGAGPYRLKEWVRGSYLVLQPHDRYVLGRPKIDEIEVRIVPDQNALVANILAGAVQLTLGRALTLDPALQVRDQWREGRMEVGLVNWFVTYPQLLTPSPAVVGEVQFRRALMHAMNRQEMAESLQAGLAPVAHTRLDPSEPEYPAIEREVVRYDFDPRRSVQLIEEMGYVRGPDGAFRDAPGRPLAVQIRTGDNDDLPQKAVFSITDYWKRIGVDTEPFIVPRQLDDAEFAATFPGFRIIRQPNDPSSLDDFRSGQAPVPENRFRGRNRARYTNPEFDALLDRYFSTIPTADRTRLLGQIERHISDQLIMMGLFYNTEPTLISNRLVGATARKGNGSAHTWNAEQWDLRG